MAARTTTTKAATETTPQPPDPEGLNVGTVHPLHAEQPGPDTAGLAKLRAPFPPEQIGKLPKSTCKACQPYTPCDRHTMVRGCRDCGGNHPSSTMHLDFVGHADLTARLLEVDPAWTWEPFSQTQIAALPPVLRDAGLWINLTVLGVTRPGFGDAGGKSGGNAVKEAIGDALRNAGMRFGIALDLWAKGDRSWAKEPDTTPEQGTPPPDAKADRPQGSVHHGQVEVANARPNDGTDPRVGVHVEAFWTDFNALTPPQQQQVRLGWPQGFPNPDALSVNQVAVVRDLCAQVRGPVGAPDPS